MLGFKGWGSRPEMNPLHLNDDKWEKEQSAAEEKVHSAEGAKFHSFNIIEANNADWYKQHESEVKALVEKEGRLASLKTKAGVFARKAALAATLLMSAASAETSRIVSGTSLGSPEKPAAASTATPGAETPKDIHGTTANVETSTTDNLVWPGGEFEMPGIDQNWFTKNPETGKTEFNAWHILAPLEIHGASKEKIEGTFNIEMPFEYARAFDLDPSSGEPLNPEDREKAMAYLKEQLTNRLADTLTEWGGTAGSYETAHGENQTRNLQVEGISVKGFASPEGPRQQGKETVAPGNVSEQNVALAQKRAESGLDLTKDELKELGFSMEQLTAAAEKIDAQELQFSEQEMEDLDSTALKLGIAGVDRLDRIFEMLKMYNDGKIKDTEAQKTLDNIVASKRKIQIEIKYKGDKRHTTVLPIPLMLLLLLAPLRFMRRRNNADTVIEEEEGPTLVENQVTERVDQPEKELDQRIQLAALPEEGSAEYNDMEQRTLIDDLDYNFDNKETEARGIDYRHMVFTIDRNWDKFPDNNAREKFVTGMVLEDWEKHDKAMRKEAGIDSADEIDYKNDPRQVQWALMHARQLVKIAEISKTRFANGETKKAHYMYVLRELTANQVVDREINRLKSTPEGAALTKVEDPLDVEVADNIREVKLPTEDSAEYKKMKSETYINDLLEHIDNPQTEENGINYKAMTEDMISQYEQFRDDSDRELYLTGKLLEAWTKHDTEQEIAKGERSEDEIKAGYADRDANPEHIAYAKFHAKALRELAQGKIKSPQSSFKGLLEAQIEADPELKQQLIDRERAKLAA